MGVRVNPYYFFLFAVLARIILVELSWLSFLAIMVSVYQFTLFYFSINRFIPIRYLMGSLMCLQMLIGPVFAYNGLDRFQEGLFRMQIPEADYFAYVLPAVVCFLVGLNFLAKSRLGEGIDLEGIKTFVRKNPPLPYYFIVIGFISSFLSGFFGKELAFVFVLLEGLKFVGLFMLILGVQGIKPVTLVLVYGSIIVSSLSVGMFHDLITWVVFLSLYYAYKYKPNDLVKGGFLLLLASLVVVIQLLKGDYREATWRRGEAASVETVAKTIEVSKQKRDPFSYESFAKSNLRINQGYIITNIMITVPSKLAFENGNELVQILEAAFLPRLFAPDKLQAGDRDIFMKYTGILLDRGTSMGLSSVGDGYINFGVIGGWIFMFFYGLFFNMVLRYFNYLNGKFPVFILFMPLIFYYPIRPDCELQTILGHLVKSTFLVLLIVNIWKSSFMASPAKI